MDRIIAPNSVALSGADTAPTTGTPQYATDGNPADGIPATQWPAYQYNAIQEELIAAIESDGTSPDRTNNNQLKTKLAGRLLRTTIFDIISGTQQFSVDGAAFTSVASTSFTSLVGTNRMQVEVLGAGASSAGAPATGASQAACGGNGGDGAYLFKTLLRARDTAYFDTPIAVTVGVGGVGQLGANGLPGGNSSFGSLVAAGGSGGSTAGPSGASTVVSSGGNGGAKPTAGDINAAGLQGNGTLIISFQGVITIPGPSPIAGHGTGGIGTSNPISSAAITGVSGQSGIVIVREYS
jgi:hypothetical protein